MFGCFNYSTRVQLADGTTEKIGKIVNNKMDVEVCPMIRTPIGRARRW
jgi:recombination protein RecA